MKSKYLDMYPGHPCKHCTASGCAIYEKRPENPCRTFMCGWLRSGSQLPDSMRPDLSGVIVVVGDSWQKWKVLRAVATGPKIPPHSLEQVKSLAYQARTPLLITEFVESDGRIVGEIIQGFGPPDFSEAVSRKLRERQQAG